ncbi:MAG: dihydrolipoyllysine-residue succinyltransferase [Gammaproteobacteria bacterium]|nr:dihydrolipoyllysine-residue succinyltransferase [Gammaproteobacteria bacterium]HAC87906.1 dihydrolipoamide succinyltransferase [Gammaproteobacteria bacterium]|tara:strand:+ start:7674 stop:8891 length:1218 start_codon:yes stop_codon:yes gene_type:complete
MTIEIKAPLLPESVPDGTILTWYKNVGDTVKMDELLADIETDKVVIEVASPIDGTLTEILKDSGDIIVSNEAIARVEQGSSIGNSETATTALAATPAATTGEIAELENNLITSPAAKKLIEENRLAAHSIMGSGKGGRITKEDVLDYIRASSSQSVPQPKISVASTENTAKGRIEERVPMSRLRAKVADRLLEAVQTTAMLTTFNEANMEAIIDIRTRYKDEFGEAHSGTRLGFMSFFVRACTEALKRFPAVNASIDGTDIVYHGYQDIGVAVSSPRGLVVPVLRNADHMGLAQVEREINKLAEKARDGNLAIEEITGGTFTISNGGVFGSLLSTPILNPPQTAILGMHKIQDRPMSVDGEIKILPMMYLALSYDHRMIDGKEAVQFLDTIKRLIEDPTRLLLEI